MHLYGRAMPWVLLPGISSISSIVVDYLSGNFTIFTTVESPRSLEERAEGVNDRGDRLVPGH